MSAPAQSSQRLQLRQGAGVGHALHSLVYGTATKQRRSPPLVMGPLSSAFSTNSRHRGAPLRVHSCRRQSLGCRDGIHWLEASCKGDSIRRGTGFPPIKSWLLVPPVPSIRSRSLIGPPSDYLSSTPADSRPAKVRPADASS